MEHIFCMVVRRGFGFLQDQRQVGMSDSGGQSLPIALCGLLQAGRALPISMVMITSFGGAREIC
jgi:hypothetical protein